MNFVYQSKEISLEAYMNGARSIVDKRSTIGFCIIEAGNLVIWRSKKQLVLARLSVEVESQAMTLEMCETVD